ncbi:MAG: tol-pal system protein YbgF [Rickettsiales bacterium]|nr:tol-pal system protein YbgF [Rickettsiales bacterium]
MFLSKKGLSFKFIFLFAFLIIVLACNTYSQEYLDVVIQRLNSVESELKDIKNSKDQNNKIRPNVNNAIATHEQRIVEIEEEIRNLNGYLDDINFKLDNLLTALDDLKNNSNGDNNQINQSSDEKKDSKVQTSDNVNEFETITESKKTVILEDPNRKNNPEMKVLGTIKKNQTSTEQENEVLSTEQSVDEFNKKNLANLKSNEELKELAKNPSDIYKYAYDMLVRENYEEAENSFKTFIGEHPKDPLASNAYYWLGETYYVQKKFQLAAISFARGYQSFPKGNKAIDQLFKLALTFMNLGKNEDACASFSKLELEFPNAPKRISNRAKEFKQRAKCTA